VQVGGKSWREGSFVLAEGRATGSTEALALASARNKAIRLLIGEIEATLPEHFKQLQRKATDLEVIANVDAQLGAVIQFDSRLATSRAHEAGFEAVARYALAGDQFDRASKFYRAEREAWGMRLVNAPPSRPPGVLVLSGSTAGVSAGDRIVMANRVPLTSVGAITDQIATKPEVELVIEAERSVTLRSKR
jgi:hypothetical protein